MSQSEADQASQISRSRGAIHLLQLDTRLPLSQPRRALDTWKYEYHIDILDVRHT